MNALLQEASKEGASDVHICVGISPRFRIHGELKPTHFPKMTASDTLEILLGLMTPEQREQFEREGEIDLSVSIPRAGRYRVNAYKQRGSITVSLRIVDMQIPDPKALQIPEEVMSLCDSPRGLILITGPSGCGKSTVIASMIDRINSTRACNIITLEDPIEYLHPHKMSIVNQREIGLDANDYQSAVSAALRQDPDVLHIGQLSQAEVAGLSLMAAETGRLVFTSMYSQGAVETVGNFIDLFPEQRRQSARNRMANALKATVSRQLIPSVDGDRVPVYEILLVDNQIREQIRQGNIYGLNALMSRGHDKGMVTMDEALEKLFREGKISQEEAIRAALDQEAMALRIS